MKIAKLFPALGNTNYRHFCLTQWIALIGFWLQMTAQQWLVYEMTKSALLLGILATCQFLPSMLFSLFIGYWIDTHNKRKILILTTSLYIVQAGLLGLLLWSNHATYEWILFFAFFCGTVDAIDMPARMAFTPELVGKQVLHSAISLNSANFNMTRMTGPLLATFLLSFLPYHSVLFLNAISLLPLLYIYHHMDVNSIIERKRGTSPLKDIYKGLKEAKRNSIIAAHLIIVAIVSGLILNFGSFGPLFSDRILHEGLQGFGSILFAVGSGSMLAALISANATDHLSSKNIFRMGMLSGLLLMIVSHISYFPLAMLLFGFIGFSVLFFIINCNTTIQMATSHEYIGRIMSIYTFVFLGITPIGSLIVTSIIEYIGVPDGLFIIGLADILLLLITAYRLHIPLWK